MNVAPLGVGVARAWIKAITRLAGKGAPHCEDGRCNGGRQCRGACTCVARAIQGHGTRCDGACEGECSDAGMATLDRTSRRLANGLLALLGAWVVFLGVSFGALVAWAYQSGLAVA